MYECVKTAYTKNKIALCFSVLMVTYGMVSIIENYVLESIAQTSELPVAWSVSVQANSSCKSFKNKHYYGKRMRQQPRMSHFYWDEGDKKAVQIVRNYSPVATLLFAGIYSDKYGGHRVVILGLFLCSLVSATCYLTVLRNSYLFLAALAVRRASQGVLWAAAISLAAKLTTVDQRTMFVSLIFVGDNFGHFIGYLVLTEVVGWRTASMVSALVAFVTTLWWYMIYKSNRFPKIRKIRTIPWKGLLTSVSFYTVCLLTFVAYFIQYIADEEYHIQGKLAHFLLVDTSLPAKFILCAANIFGNVFCGACSDYMISRGIASTTATRKSFIASSLVSLFLTLAVIRLERCGRLLSLAQTAVLKFIKSMAWSTTIAAVLDFSSPCAGTLTGLAFISALTLKYPLFQISINLIVSAFSENDVNRWSGLVFLITTFGLLCSLPFLCVPFKVLQTVVEESPRDSARNAKSQSLDLTGVTALKDVKPGP